MTTFNITVSVPDENIKSIMENLPECALSFQCHHWDYDRCEFRLRDCETLISYTIGLIEVRNGLVKMFADISNGKLERRDIPVPSSEDALCKWDAEAIDILLQYAVFGAIMYS